MKSVVGVILVFAAALNQPIISQRPQWDPRNEADRATSRGCSNLTIVLDNWKFAIMNQVKDLLTHDHNTVLPDYGRIQPLSDALGDLYKEFNALKDRLSELTAKFDAVESFVDDVRTSRKAPPPVGEPRPPGSPLGGMEVGALPPAGGVQGRRSRVVIRRVVKPVGTKN